jgi:chromosome partitioning protein
MDTKIISICNQKGGCGKTTITMQLSGLLGKNYKVLVIDADPQATATRWAASAEENKLFPAHVVGLSAAGTKVHQEVKKFIGYYDYIFIDCPPAVDSNVPQSALLISNLAIVPIIPSPADLWASAGIETLINNMKDINDNLNAIMVPNMCQTNINLNNEVLSILVNFDIPVSDNRLVLRTAYRQSATIGGIVSDIQGGEKASEEIKGLLKEVINLV